jgi:hypothetical protein
VGLPEEPEAFEVLPENWEAVMMWMRVATQWRTSMNGPQGLDYNVLRWMFGLYNVTNEREMLDDLRLMETTVLGLRAENGI